MTMQENESLAPMHPGEILMHEFLEPLGISAHALALTIGVPANRLHAIVHGKRGISADTALRLSRYFGLSESYWMNLQSRYELLMAKGEIGPALLRIAPHPSADAT